MRPLQFPASGIRQGLDWIRKAKQRHRNTKVLISSLKCCNITQRLQQIEATLSIGRTLATIGSARLKTRQPSRPSNSDSTPALLTQKKFNIVLICYLLSSELPRQRSHKWRSPAVANLLTGRGILQKEKEANIASMTNGIEAPLESSVVQSYYV
jgi:hypothetical protein